MAKLRIALIPGDGIGVDVVREAVKVLDAVAARTGLAPEYTSYDIGSRRYLATGELMPKPVLGELAQSDAILFGAIGDPSVAPGILERGIILELRFAFQYYLNLRPVRLLRGAKGVLADKGPDDIDMVVLREGTEGPYAGAGGSVHTGSPLEVVTETSIHTRVAVERIVRDAFERSLVRRRKVCLIAKSNILVHSGSLWQRTFDEVAAEYPGVETDYVHVDAAAMYLLTSPERFDVVVTDNMFGDILTDIGAAIAGGIGLAASGNIDPTRRNPSMFEPVHGSAPDIAGQSKADPTAAVLSLAMLLEHVGQTEAAGLVQSAVEADLMQRGGTARSTEQVGDAIAELAASLA